MVAREGAPLNLATSAFGGATQFGAHEAPRANTRNLSWKTTSPLGRELRETIREPPPERGRRSGRTRPRKACMHPPSVPSFRSAFRAGGRLGRRVPPTETVGNPSVGPLCSSGAMRTPAWDCLGSSRVRLVLNYDVGHILRGEPLTKTMCVCVYLVQSLPWLLPPG